MGLKVTSVEERVMESQTAVFESIAHYSNVPITVGSHLIDDLLLDSLDLVELALDIECQFEITVPDETLEEWKTVNDVLIGVAKLIREEFKA